MTTLDVTAACFDVIKSAIIIFSMSFVITGVVVGIFQTVFSIQDQGLPMVAKLLVMMFLLAYIGGDIFEKFHALFKSI